MAAAAEVLLVLRVSGRSRLTVDGDGVGEGEAGDSGSDEFIPCCEKKLVRLSTIVDSHNLRTEQKGGFKKNELVRWLVEYHY